MLRSATLSLILALACATPAAAATFTVTTTQDAVDATIDGTCAIAGGGCSLRAALQEANATTDPDDIALPAGRFKIALGGTSEDAAARGDFDSTHDVTITGAGANLTVIDGNDADRVLHEVGGNLTVQRVTITGGQVDDSGVGILQDSGALVVRDSAIVGNRTADNSSGGGIEAGGTSALIERSLMAGNHAYNGGALDGSAPITVRASTIAHNTAGDPTANGDGGAADSPVTYIDSTIVGNIAWNGAGSPGGAEDPTLRNTVIAGNLAFDTSNPTDPAAPSNCDGTVTSQGNNVSDDDTCTLSGPGDRTSLDPQLSDLADHGGPFASIVPLPGSPLIDTGAGCDALDMRGGARPSGAACDVGAIETALPAIAAGAAGTALGSNAAFITGGVDPAFSATTAHVEFGPTTAYGSATADAAANGAFAAVLTGLAPGTAYHARIVATNAYGTTAGPDVTFTTQAPQATRDAKAPKLRNLKIAKKLRGKVTFSLDEKAAVRLLFIAPNGRRKATLKASGHSGKNSAKLPKALKAGRYAVVSWATDTAGNRSTPSLKTIRLRKK